jgi:hypothetical protein
MYRVVESDQRRSLPARANSEIKRREIELWGFGLLPNQLGACLRKRPGTKEGESSAPPRVPPNSLSPDSGGWTLYKELKSPTLYSK